MPNTTIQLKKSSTPSSVPADLANGELAINFADGKLFYKNTAGFIAEISGGGGGGSNFGTVNANSTLIVADTSGDVLTIEAGEGIAITGDAVNDKLTISSKFIELTNRNYEYGNSAPKGTSNLTATVVNADDTSYEISLPFNVEFLGNTYNVVHLSTNSLLGFGGPYSSTSAFDPPKANPFLILGPADRRLLTYYTGYEDGLYILRYEGREHYSTSHFYNESQVDFSWEIWFDPVNPEEITIVIDDALLTGGTWGMHDGNQWIDNFFALPHALSSYYEGAGIPLTYTSIKIRPGQVENLKNIRFAGYGVDTYNEGSNTVVYIDPLKGELEILTDTQSDQLVLASPKREMFLRTPYERSITLDSGSFITLKGRDRNVGLYGDGGAIILEAGDGYQDNVEYYASGGSIFITAGIPQGTYNPDSTTGAIKFNIDEDSVVPEIVFIRYGQALFNVVVNFSNTVLANTIQTTGNVQVNGTLNASNILINGVPIGSSGNLVNLSTGVTGVLPIANGGTGQTTARDAINELEGFLSIQSPTTLTQLTANSPRTIVVTDNSIQTIRMPNTATITAGYTYHIHNQSAGGQLTVQEFNGFSLATLEERAYARFVYVDSFNDWSVVHGGATLKTGSGALTYATEPSLVNPNITYDSANVAAGSDTTGSAYVDQEVSYITSTPFNPSAVTLPGLNTGQRRLVFNLGTNPLKVYPTPSVPASTIDGQAGPITISVGQSRNIYKSNTYAYVTDANNYNTVVVGAGANAYASAVGVAANTIAIAAFDKANTGVANLSLLSDVQITSPNTGEFLVYNTGKWTNSNTLNHIIVPRFMGAMINLSSSTSGANYVGNTIPFGSEVYDTDNFHSNVTANTRLTIPSGLGIKKVRLTATIRATSTITAGTDMFAAITKNGTNAYPGTAIITHESPGFSNPGINISTGVVDVADGDYFELYYQITDTSSGLDANTTFFSIQVVETADGVVGKFDLNSISDVVVTTPSEGHVLRYEGGIWKNTADYARDTANAANIIAITAFNFANTINTIAIAAFDKANTGTGGGASVNVGNTLPSVNTAGSLWWNNDLGRLFISYNDGDSTQWVDAAPPGTGPAGPQGLQGVSAPKTATIEFPQANDVIPLFYNYDSFTLTEIRSVLLGSAGANVTFSVRYADSIAVTGTEVVTGGIICTNTTNGLVTTTFTNPTVPANNFVWVTISAATNTTNTLHFTMR